MVNKGFPSFGMSQAGAYITSLKNYSLPDFILQIVAKECKSDLLERGRIDDKLQSMNDESLELLHKVFVECEDDSKGKFAQYRFFAYVSSMYHKCDVVINETIPGDTGKNHKVPIAIKLNGMYIAVAFNKFSGNPINKKEAAKFYETVRDIKLGDHGTMLEDGIYGSSVGFRKEAVEGIKSFSNIAEDSDENKLNFKIANFENNIYSVVKF